MCAVPPRFAKREASSGSGWRSKTNDCGLAAAEHRLDLLCEPGVDTDLVAPPRRVGIAAARAVMRADHFAAEGTGDHRAASDQRARRGEDRQCHDRDQQADQRAREAAGDRIVAFGGLEALVDRELTGVIAVDDARSM